MFVVGMLLAGLLLRNVPYVTDAIFIATEWSAALRNIALSIILTRAGLGLDPHVSMHARMHKGLVIKSVQYISLSVCVYVCACVCRHYIV